MVKLLGVKINDEEAATKYLKDYVLKKEVFLKFDSRGLVNREIVEAYVYLKNKIFINSYLIKSGMATADKLNQYQYKNKFIELEAEVS